MGNSAFLLPTQRRSRVPIKLKFKTGKQGETNMDIRIDYFARIVALTVALIALPTVAFSAQTQIVNIDSRVNDVQHAVEVVLDAGTYSVTPIGTNEGGAFNAWNAWGFTTCTDVNGCPQTVPTTFEGWLNRYWVSSPNLTKVSVNGTALTPVSVEPVPLLGNIFVANASTTYYQADDIKVYPADIVALDKSQSSTFTLSESGPVRFAINDPALFDNVGGISFRVIQESTTPMAIDPTSVPKAIKIGEFFTKQLLVINGVGPFSWSITGGELPSGLTMSTDGLLSGTPSALGTSSFTIQVSNAVDVAEKTFQIDIVLAMPLPKVSIFKGSTTPVPGRTIDTFIYLENVDDVVAKDLIVTEYIANGLSLSSITPLGEIDSAVPSGASAIRWTIPELAPGNSKLLYHQGFLSSSIPVGKDIATHTCLDDEMKDILACIDNIDVTETILSV